LPKQNYYEIGQLTDLAYLILVTLIKPRHGYSIMNEVTSLTDGIINIGPASLYTTLKRLTEIGLIKLIDDSEKKKVYFITDNGLQSLLADIEKRKRLVACGLRALNEFKEGK